VYVETEVPIVPDNPTENDKCVWDYKMNDYLKTRRVLKGNLQILFNVLMALCETKVRSQVKALPEYKDIQKILP